jgi:hypothetical protein
MYVPSGIFIPMAWIDINNGKSKVIFPTHFGKGGYKGKGPIGKLKRQLGKILKCILRKYNIYGC